MQSLSAGDLFTLSDFPNDDQNKQYLVVDAWFESVNNAHDWGHGGGAFFRSAFTLIAAGQTFRPHMAARSRASKGPRRRSSSGRTAKRSPPTSTAA